MYTRRRNSLRLKGYDYSQPGEYFVTICTADRRCILGEVVAGKMRLSEIGKIVESCWRKIPEHFPKMKVDAFQIMPNHVHGVLIIKDHVTVVAQHAAPLQEHICRNAKPVSGSLNAVVRSFKSGATKQIHERGLTSDSIWQRSFHDHIIRDDIDLFFVRHYIAINPIMWKLDTDNPHEKPMSIEQIMRILKEEHGLDDHAVRAKNDESRLVNHKE